MYDVIVQKVLEKNSTNNSKYLEDVVTKFVESVPESVTKAFMYRNAKTVPENIEIILKNAESYNINLHKLTAIKLQQLIQYDNSYNLVGSSKLVNWFEDNDEKGKYRLWLMNNEEKRIYAGYLSIIGWYYGKSYNYKKCIEYFTKSKEIYKDVKGYEAYKANVTFGLAQVYTLLGNVQEAQQNIQILEQQLDNKLIDKADKSMLYSAKAKLFYIEGKYNEALKQINNSIENSISNGLSPNALLLTGRYMIKAETLNSLGKYQEALNQVEQVYNMQKNVQKETNEIFGKIYSQKAIALFGLGEKDKALEYANKALEIFKNNDKNFMSRRMSDVFNPTIAVTCTIRGDILFADGKLEEALDSYMDARGIYLMFIEEIIRM